MNFIEHGRVKKRISARTPLIGRVEVYKKEINERSVMTLLLAETPPAVITVSSPNVSK